MADFLYRGDNIYPVITALANGQTVTKGTAYGFQYDPGTNGRGDRRWILFSEGRYLDGEGKEIVVSNSTGSSNSSASNAVRIARYTQFSSVGNGTVSQESGTGYSQTVKVGSRTFKVYNQGAFGGNIPGAGCSISSEAIVLSGYGKNKTPANIASDVPYYPRAIADIANDLTGYGVSSTSRVSYGSARNSSVRNTAYSEIDRSLKNGKPVIILVRANISSKYTRGAHYMALVGYANGKPIIADPNGGRVWNEDSLDTIINTYIYTGSSYEEGYVFVN